MEVAALLEAWVPQLEVAALVPQLEAWVPQPTDLPLLPLLKGVRPTLGLEARLLVLSPPSFRPRANLGICLAAES